MSTRRTHQPGQPSDYVTSRIARAPRLTDEQARGLVVLFNRGLAQGEARHTAETRAAS